MTIQQHIAANTRLSDETASAIAVAAANCKTNHESWLGVHIAQAGTEERPFGNYAERYVASVALSLEYGLRAVAAEEAYWLQFRTVSRTANGATPDAADTLTALGTQWAELRDLVAQVDAMTAVLLGHCNRTYGTDPDEEFETSPELSPDEEIMAAGEASGAIEAHFDERITPEEFSASLMAAGAPGFYTTTGA